MHRDGKERLVLELKYVGGRRGDASGNSLKITSEGTKMQQCHIEG